MWIPTEGRKLDKELEEVVDILKSKTHPFIIWTKLEEVLNYTDDVNEQIRMMKETFDWEDAKNSHDFLEKYLENCVMTDEQRFIDEYEANN